MIAALTTADASPLFGDEEKAAIALAIELTRTARLSPATFERAARHFSEPQLVELVVNVGVANLNNRLSEAFWADPFDLSSAGEEGSNRKGLADPER
jgi:alkylhydroperoxidase family enzyme